MASSHYLLYGHGGAYNHGGEAITRCTIEWLRKISPDCFITLSTHFSEQDIEFGIDADEIVSRNLSGKTNKEVYYPTLKKITPNTTVIQVGGDNYCYANWQRYAQIHETAKKCGGRSILWGCSLDAEKINEELLDVLRRHDLILARECLTYQTFRRKGLNNVLQVSDIAFTLEPEKIDFPLENYIVVNISPLVCRKNPYVLNAVQELLRFVLEKTDFNIALLPHVVMPADNDVEALTAIGLPNGHRVVMVSDKLSARQYKHIVSRARLCVAARTHVTIAAYSSCVPALAISYSTKAKGIAMDLGLSDYVIDILDLKIKETMLCQFEKLMMEERDLRRQLTLQMEGYRRKAFHEAVVTFLKGEK